MDLAIVALTKNGFDLAFKIRKKFNGDIYFNGSSMKNDNIYFFKDLKKLVKKIFCKYKEILFIMAVGIVVRIIAPFIVSKEKDPAIVVMDELGKNTISLLSGHLGGANELTVSLSLYLNSNPVISTATDLNNKIAFDMVAKKNNFKIENIDCLKRLSAAILRNEQVVLITDLKVKNVKSYLNIYTKKEYSKIENCNIKRFERVYIDNGLINEKVLILRPKNLILGIGARKGINLKEVEFAIFDFLFKNNKSMNSLKKIASIDLKKNEKGIVEFSEKYNIDFVCFSKKEILRVEKFFKGSDFVKKKVGVSSVAEPCSFLAGYNCKLILKKIKYKNITLALSEEEYEVVL